MIKQRIMKKGEHDNLLGFSDGGVTVTAERDASKILIFIEDSYDAHSFIYTPHQIKVLSDILSKVSETYA